MNEPLTRAQIQRKVKKLFKLGLEDFSAKVADIVLVERLKVLSHSDKSSGEWRQENPHDPQNKGE